MKPNVLFITIDSLRSDHVYGNSHSANSPNIKSLIEHGTSFTQAISTSDATGTSIGSIFSACFPFKTDITHFTFNQSVPLFSNILKKNGYFLSSTVPDISFFSHLTSEFDKNDHYVYDKREDWLQLEGGIGDKILEQLNFLNQQTPWFYFIHLMDLHAPFFLPTKFKSSKYGVTEYEQMISLIDIWLGKICNEINFDETILILSADHGDYIPIHDVKFKSSSNFQKILRKGKKVMPELEPLGVKLFEKTKSIVEKKKLEKLQKTLSEKDFRTLGTRGTTTLFDEVLLIPIIFSGNGIPKSKTIKQLVRQVDIFPTLLKFLDIPFDPKNIHGQSLYPLFSEKTLNELPGYIETGSRNPKKEGELIGIRTSKYKYLKNRKNNSNESMLYDIQNDPGEENNISSENPEICNEMETLLLELKNDSFSHEKHQLSKDDESAIEEELKKLGYL